MRERLVAAFALVTLLVLVVFTLARAYALDATVTAATEQQVQRSATVLAALVAEREAADRPVTAATLLPVLDEAERVEYVDPAGRPVRAAAPGFHGAGAGADPGADPGSDTGPDVVATAPVAGGGTITLRRSGSWVDEQVDEGMLPLVLLGILMVAVAALLGYLAARMLSRPFQELAGHATTLGRGRFDLEVPRYAVPEADTIGRALQTSAGQLRDMLRRERDFATSASHELRTPITALRLELEDLALSPELSGPAAEHLRRGLGEVDRLSDTVDDLLARSRGARLGSVAGVDVARLAEDAVRRTEGSPATTGRAVAAVVDGPVTVHLPPGPIDALLDALLASALDGAAGPVTVEVRDVDDHVQVRVGPGPRAGADRTPGWHDATELADALGARLSRDPGGVSLLLPRG